MSQQANYTRASDCIEPRGPLKRTTFYRHVRAGYIPLAHVGRMAFVPFPSPDALIEHLIRVVPPSDRFGRPAQSEPAE
jgi:hypothetical protein